MLAVNRNVGIKLGIENYLVLDNGTRIQNPKYFDRSMNKIRRLDRELKRKRAVLIGRRQGLDWQGPMNT